MFRFLATRRDELSLDRFPDFASLRGAILSQKSACQKPEYKTLILNLEYFEEGHAIDDSSPGLTPLFYASIMNKPKSVKVLLELGADYFIRNDYTISPLYAACQRKNVEVVKAFSDFGIDLHHWRFRAKNGMSPFLEGCTEGSVELLQPFIDHKNIDEDMLWACIQQASDPAVLKERFIFKNVKF